MYVLCEMFIELIVFIAFIFSSLISSLFLVRQVSFLLSSFEFETGSLNICNGESCHSFIDWNKNIDEKVLFFFFFLFSFFFFF
jgi:hypothetical protein